MATEKATHPIKTLREHIAALEAAVDLALADPHRDPVHRLRTSTRRVEAQLQLLRLIPNLPDHSEFSRASRKLLRKLRQAAGAVRDLDVQRKLVKEQQALSPASKQLGKEASHLRRILKQRRSTEATHLLRILKKRRKELAPTFEQLLHILSPAENIKLSPTGLSQLTLDWYLQTTPARNKDDDPDILHSIRKSAKLARYIAEAGDGKLAQKFEALQQAGGTWHDLLTLAHVARKELGVRSPLTQAFTRARDNALDGYRHALMKQDLELPREYFAAQAPDEPRLQSNYNSVTSA